MEHIHTLIKQFSYRDLCRGGIIPDLEIVTPTIPTKRYPGWISHSDNPEIFSHFSLFIEEIVYRAIIQTTKLDYSAIWTEGSPDKSLHLLDGIVSLVRTMFVGYDDIRHRPELIYKTIQGHPDLVGQGWILDIKTTTNFSKISHDCFLQILAYGALAQAIGMDILTIGVLLPLQGQILWYDISQWNLMMYMKIILRESRWIKYDLAIPAEHTISSPYLGNHIPKDEIIGWPPNLPFQIFLSSPQSRDGISPAEIDKLKRDIKLEHQLYVHSPYIINLCNDKTWSIERLCHELRVCRQIGGKGVVVHVGKHKELTYEQGMTLMEQHLRTALREASPECPLLLETPAGEGTELYSNLSSILQLFERFKDNPCLKLCVDTCHVFANGYEPLYYIKCCLNNIGLIHFNDSKEKRGSRLDRHRPPGSGYIGFNRMWRIHEFCLKNKIPMIIE